MTDEEFMAVIKVFCEERRAQMRADITSPKHEATVTMIEEVGRCLIEVSRPYVEFKAAVRRMIKEVGGNFEHSDIFNIRQVFETAVAQAVAGKITQTNRATSEVPSPSLLTGSQLSEEELIKLKRDLIKQAYQNQKGIMQLDDKLDSYRLVKKAWEGK